MKRMDASRANAGSVDTHQLSAHTLNAKVNGKRVSVPDVGAMLQQFPTARPQEVKPSLAQRVASYIAEGTLLAGLGASAWYAGMYIFRTYMELTLVDATHYPDTYHKNPEFFDEEPYAYAWTNEYLCCLIGATVTAGLTLLSVYSKLRKGVLYVLNADRRVNQDRYVRELAEHAVKCADLLTNINDQVQKRELVAEWKMENFHGRYNNQP